MRCIEGLQSFVPQAISVFRAPVAQLDRAPGYEPGGREFESLRARHWIEHVRPASKFQKTEVTTRVPFPAV
jgi:hypothetical protein